MLVKLQNQNSAMLPTTKKTASKEDKLLEADLVVEARLAGAAVALPGVAVVAGSVVTTEAAMVVPAAAHHVALHVSKLRKQTVVLICIYNNFSGGHIVDTGSIERLCHTFYLNGVSDSACIAQKSKQIHSKPLSHVRAADFSNVFVPDSYADTASAVRKSDVTTNSFGSASAKVWTSDSL